MVPQRVQLLVGEDIIQVSCGGTHSVDLARDGGMYTVNKMIHFVNLHLVRLPDGLKRSLIIQLKQLAMGLLNRYADLKNNRSTNYVFNHDEMLSDSGNTDVYILYAHTRICSIIENSGKDVEELKHSGKIVMGHDDERVLGFHLL